MLTRLFEHRPILRERLSAFAVFTGIALGGVAGVEMVIGAGFDPITPGFAYQAEAPRTWYDRPVAPHLGWTTEAYNIHTVALPAQLDLDATESAEARQAPLQVLASAPEARIAFVETPMPDYFEGASTSIEETAKTMDEDPMAAVEAMIAQALGEDSYNAVPLTPSGTASPS